MIYKLLSKLFFKTFIDRIINVKVIFLKIQKLCFVFCYILYQNIILRSIIEVYPMSLKP